jgi:hypothetical protein
VNASNLGFGAAMPGDPAGLALQDFVKLCSYLAREEFLRRYAHPFLLTLSQDQDTNENPGFGTISGNIRKVLVDNEFSNARVLLVTKRAANAFSMMVTVGRAENNDIIIRNGKVSKFHAYFNEIGGQWALTDGNSSNGTYVNNERLVPNTRYPISDGTDLSFSTDLAFRFIAPESMFNQIQRLSNR